MKFSVIIEKDEDVYVAYCNELLGWVTYAETLKEAKIKIKEAVELYLRAAPKKVFI